MVHRIAAGSKRARQLMAATSEYKVGSSQKPHMGAKQAAKARKQQAARLAKAKP